MTCPPSSAIEEASFTTPWPPDAYRSELETNRMAHYLVARVGETVAAYGGMWLMVDEAHITTFAVHPAWRRQGIGERLLLAFLDIAVDRVRPRGHARGPAVQPAGAPAVREVRLPPGRAAPALLQRRPRGRADHDHGAARRTRRCATRIARLRAALDASPAPAAPGEDDWTRERPAPPVDRVVVRRDRHRPHRGRPAHPQQRRRLAGRAARAVGRDRAGGRRARPPALDRARARRGLGGRRRDLGRHRRRRRHLRSRPGRLAAGRDQLRQGARLGPRQAAHRGQPPRGPRLRRLAARPGRGRGGQAGADLPARRPRRQWRPHVPGRDARPPDLPAARHDRRRRGRRGVRQGRPAAGPRLSGWPGHPEGGRGRDPPRRPLPAGLDGRYLRLELLRAQDRGPADRRRGPGRGGPRRRDDPEAHAVRGDRRRARLGLPGRRRRRARDQDDPGRARRSVPARSCSAAASRPTASCAIDCAARRTPGRCRSSCRDPACARTTGR